VLIVDDDSLVITSAAALIEDLGHTSIEARSGADALAKLAGGLEVDVVITDQVMPTMTGLELARHIQEQYPRLPIILATGSAEAPFDPEMKSLFKLTKPCTQHEIAMAISVAVSSPRP
jgi:CheY-like chemotaxis protein